MTSKQDKIDQMVKKLFELSSFDASLKSNISDFVETAINGDEIEQSHITVVSSTKGEVYIIFVLTNARLIKIEISSAKKSSEEFNLDSIKIEWVSGEAEGVRISSPTGSFGIRNIDEDDRKFFKAVGEARAKAGTPHGQH